MEKKNERLPEWDSVEPEPLSKEALIVLHALQGPLQHTGWLCMDVFVCEIQIPCMCKLTVR